MDVAFPVANCKSSIEIKKANTNYSSATAHSPQFRTLRGRVHINAFYKTADTKQTEGARKQSHKNTKYKTQKHTKIKCTQSATEKTDKYNSVRISEAHSVNNAGSSLIIMLLRNPHLFERLQRGQ